MDDSARCDCDRDGIGARRRTRISLTARLCPAVPPPEPEQQVSPPTRIASNATITRNFPLRRKASGSSTAPVNTVPIPQPDNPALRAEAAAPPVATCTATLPGAFAATVSLAGLKLQVALAGSDPHEYAKVPVEPLKVVNSRVKLAVCPLDTVWLDDPETVAAKSNPIPESPACAGAAIALLVSVSLRSAVQGFPD